MNMMKLAGITALASSAFVLTLHPASAQQAGGSSNLSVIQLPEEGAIPAHDPQKSIPAPVSHDLPRESGVKDGMSNLNIPSTEVNNIITSLQFCAGNSDTSARLSCYDEVSVRNNIHVSTEPKGNGASTQWVQKNDSSSHDYIAAISSGIQIDTSGKRLNVPLELYVRCHNDNPSLYFKTGMDVGLAPVSVQMKAETSSIFGKYSLQASKSGEAFGFWSRNDVQNMVRYLVGVSGLVVHYKIEDQAEVSAHFDLSDMKRAADTVIRMCHL